MSNVVFLKGFSECTMKDKMPLMLDDDGDAVNVLNLTANFKLCSKSNETCTLCLVIHTELHIRVDNNTEDEEHSGIVEKEDDSEEMRNVKGITKDYMQPFIMTLHVIKRYVTVNHLPKSRVVSDFHINVNVLELSNSLIFSYWICLIHV